MPAYVVLFLHFWCKFKLTTTYITKIFIVLSCESKLDLLTLQYYGYYILFVGEKEKNNKLK
jgi:hypothetical protein